LDGWQAPGCDLVIEKRCHAEAELPGAGPGEVLENHVVIRLGSFLDFRETGFGIRPARAVHDEAIDDTDEALGENIGELALPPEDEREVRVQVGEDRVAEAPGDAS